MTVFVDASALVAIAAREADALDLAARLRQTAPALCSSISLWETLAALCRSYGLSVPVAEARVRLFIGTLELRIVTLGSREYQVAAEAYARFGRGRHKAGLNMGDCFAYACARTNEAKLLFKGEDFSWTDIEAA